MFWDKSTDQQADTSTNLVDVILNGLQKTWPQTELMPASVDNPVESIVVPLPATENQQKVLLKLSLTSSGYRAMKKLNDPDVSDDKGTFAEFDYLQFYTPLISQINANYIQETALLIERINSQVPLMGFNLNTAQDMTVSYRHMLILECKKPNLKLITRSATLSGYVINQFFPALNAIATGEKTLSDL
ncbi:MAG: hypothetical protein AAGF24_10905, partial [Cyanobacteria bacterium P01_H01_bin.121]